MLMLCKPCINPDLCPDLLHAAGTVCRESCYSSLQLTGSQKCDVLLLALQHLEGSNSGSQGERSRAWHEGHLLQLIAAVQLPDAKGAVGKEHGHPSVAAAGGVPSASHKVLRCWRGKVYPSDRALRPSTQL